MKPTPEQQRDLDSRYYHTGLENMGIGFNHEPTDPRTDHIPYDITTPIMPAHPSSCTCPDCYEFVFGKENDNA